MIFLSTAVRKRFFALLDQMHTGTLHLYTPDGRIHTFGGGDPVAHWDMHDWRTIEALAMRGDIGLGESYAQGWWDTPDLETLSHLALINHDVIRDTLGGALMQRIAFLATDRVFRRNSRSGSRANIRAHYDISNAFYSQWLDPSMTYSAALYSDDDDDLETAQHRKYDRLLECVGQSGERTLEIGCGWGGFAERALETTDRNVTAVTISKAQHAFATERLKKQGLAERGDIRLQDYRDLTGQYDAIVSIEMIEAVGERYWPTYFNTLKQRLAPGGRAALQAIIVEDDVFDIYRNRSDFIRKYTFPGGMLISPAQINAHARKAGLEVQNLFRFGKHYARTLREWRTRFDAITPNLEAEGYKPEFLRGWRFYLDTCAAAFQLGARTNVVHVELSHA